MIASAKSNAIARVCQVCSAVALDTLIHNTRSRRVKSNLTQKAGRAAVLVKPRVCTTKKFIEDHALGKDRLPVLLSLFGHHARTALLRSHTATRRDITKHG